MALKKLGSAGRFGARYGRKIKKKVLEIERVMRSKHKCPYCQKPGVKRVSLGIWYCSKCKSKFAGKAYEPSVTVEFNEE
jgi:large subunit ribosomal protein L37Ae